MLKKISVLPLLAITCFMLPVEAQFGRLDFGQCDTGYGDAWIVAEYLLWEIKNSPEPVPLVIEEPNTAKPAKTVLGKRKIDTHWHSGFRITTGSRYNGTISLGIESNYFYLGRRSKKFAVSSDANGSPSLRVPYYNVTTGSQDSSPLATPGLYRGTAALKLDNWMQGAEFNILSPPSFYNCSTKYDFLVGFRYWNYDEHLKFLANSPIISPPSVYNYRDKFHVRNNFYGAQIGAGLEYNYCAFFLKLRGKVAFGALSQQVGIAGRFNTNEFTGAVETFKGGFFALPTNIGHHKKTCFSVLPEIDICLGYQVADWLRLQLGYSFLYVSNVVYAGKQINPRINPTQSANIDFTSTPTLIGQPSPKARLHREGLWAQGLTAGFEWLF